MFDMDSQDCPHCGEPMERVDDFWFCDNQDCPAKRKLKGEEQEPKAPVASADRDGRE